MGDRDREPVDCGTFQVSVDTPDAILVIDGDWSDERVETIDLMVRPV